MFLAFCNEYLANDLQHKLIYDSDEKLDWKQSYNRKLN